MGFRNAATGVVVVCLSAGTVFGVDYAESIDGDLSGDQFNPTSLGVLGMGLHSISAISVAGDREYFHINIGPGTALGSITLVSFVSQSIQSFGAVESGTAVTTDPVGLDPSALLGWTHFGPGVGNVGTDILDDMGMGPGAIGFSGALGPGDYSFWFQETGPNTAAYALLVEVVPAGPTIGLLGVAGVFASRRRRV